MGFLDALTGRRKLAAPAKDRLFAMSTAYVTLQAQMGRELPMETDLGRWFALWGIPI